MMKFDPLDERRMFAASARRAKGELQMHINEPVPRAEKDNVYENEDFIDIDFALKPGGCGLELFDSINYHRFVACRFWYSRISIHNYMTNNAFLRCDFHGATFYGSNYAESCFIGSTFTDASMTNSEFYLDDFKRCTFAGADLTGSRFFGCDLRDVDFTGANLEGCIFSKCAYADDLFEGALGASLNEKYTDERALALFEARSEDVKKTKPPCRPFATLEELSYPFNLTALDQEPFAPLRPFDLEKDDSVPDGTDARHSSLDTYAQPLPEGMDANAYLTDQLKNTSRDKSRNLFGRDQFGVPEGNPRDGFRFVPWVKDWSEQNFPFSAQKIVAEGKRLKEEERRKKEEEAERWAQREADAKRQLADAKARYEASQKSKSAFSKLFGHR